LFVNTEEERDLTETGKDFGAYDFMYPRLFLIYTVFVRVGNQKWGTYTIVSCGE